MECIFSNVFRGGDFLRILTVLSDLMVPLLIFYVVGLGLLMKQDVFGDFLNGAKDGMRTVIGIVPTLIGLMAAVGVLRSSGFLEDFGKLLGAVLEPAGIPSALVPLGVVRLFSNSAAVSLLLDLYKEAGCDSFAGRAASIMMSCTETVFYTTWCESSPVHYWKWDWESARRRACRSCCAPWNEVRRDSLLRRRDCG